MSVIVENITKIYGTQKAVDGVSFEAKKGDILGLLGPNGAGKTTTMKILTCFLPPSSGSATVCGFDIFKQQLEVRASIGYLPEHNPLYPEMYVREFLELSAGIFKLDNKQKRISEIIEMTELGLEQNKKIAELSKGYKQRVGLAQALLHDPPVLILDEPISGLDPNQLVEIRKLIKELGKEKTIIFSSHILQEVTALCDRVIILNKGKLVTDRSIDDMTGLNKVEQSIDVEFLKPVDISHFKEKFNSYKVIEKGGNSFTLKLSSDDEIRIALFDYAVESGNKIVHLNKKTASVEDVFQQLTAG